MKTKKLYFVFTILIALNFSFLIYSCGSTTQKTNQDSNTEPLVTFDEFTTLPAQVEGCSIIYSGSEKGFDENKYIFAYDFNQTAFVKLNGVMTTFTRSEAAKDIGKTTVVKYKNEKYELIVTVNEKKENGPESVINIGTLELIDKSGKSVKKNFYGVAGC